MLPPARMDFQTSDDENQDFFLFPGRSQIAPKWEIFEDIWIQLWRLLLYDLHETVTNTGTNSSSSKYGCLWRIPITVCPHGTFENNTGSRRRTFVSQPLDSQKKYVCRKVSFTIGYYHRFVDGQRELVVLWEMLKINRI